MERNHRQAVAGRIIHRSTFIQGGAEEMIGVKAGRDGRHMSARHATQPGSAQRHRSHVSHLLDFSCARQAHGHG